MASWCRRATAEGTRRCGILVCMVRWPANLTFTLGLWSTLLLAALVARAPSGWTPVDVSKLGPQVGTPVPDFALTDQNGKIWTLQSLIGPKGAMLVFYRSADW